MSYNGVRSTVSMPDEIYEVLEALPGGISTCVCRDLSRYYALMAEALEPALAMLSEKRRQEMEEYYRSWPEEKSEPHPHSLGLEFFDKPGVPHLHPVHWYALADHFERTILKRGESVGR